MIDELQAGWAAFRQPLVPGAALGAVPFACLAGVALIVLVLFRPQIGRLLDRTVYLRVLGLRLVALPPRDRSERTAAPTGPRGVSAGRPPTGTSGADPSPPSQRGECPPPR